ncbi:MAG TPA: serine hydrolase [Chitinophagaceae bacterium]|nr:serine hydrolase [Chitinophagaceae bacterium]
MRFTCIVMFWVICIRLLAQPKTDSFLVTILNTDQNELFQRVLHDPQNYRLQIIYTQINRNKHNKPSFKNYYFNNNPDLYFNPASTVKLPLAFLSLEKLKRMHVNKVTKFTAMQFDSSYEKQTRLYSDSTSQNHLPSIAHFIRKAFLVSDNDAYNRMYQFVGQQTINRSLLGKGYTDMRITRQFMGFTPGQNRHTNAISFVNDDGDLIYFQPPAYNPDSFYFPHEIKIGKAHYDANDSLVNEPIDFTYANNESVQDLQQLLQSVLFPSSVPRRQRFNLTHDDYKFLYQYLSQFPSETNYPKYDTAKFYDTYAKFYFKFGSHLMPADVRVFNKVGWAYGFLTDVSYIADFKNKVEFMLTTTIYVNSDGVLNDNKYDYDSLGYPFLYQLGQTLYQYELKRKRHYMPDLSRFRMRYEKRDPNDTRALIHEVDN